MTIDEIMKLVPGCQKRDTFVQTCRKTGLRRIKINKRVFRYGREEVIRWIEAQRQKGV